MANGPALSTAKGGEIYVGNKIINSLSLLDVLYANEFEEESLHPELLDQTEQNFYRGAPPKWLNFHISDSAYGTGTLVKRDGYDKLVKQINQKRKRPGISTVKLFHQPGCGGTTLAMQVLWDLRKTIRSAVLTDSTSDITDVAAEVVRLYTAGSHYYNTVLLLVNDEQNLDNLQDSIRTIIAEQKVVTYMPVVIILSCVRKDTVRESDHVTLQKKLSETEKQKFDEKMKALSKRYRDKSEQFHGFNIMQTNFSQAYIRKVCSVFTTVKRANRPQKTQLAGFLSLLNAYVPGSYLLKSQCLDFFKHDDYIHGDFSLEDRMECFSHLIITFKDSESSEEKVRMAHPMIAYCCTELMADSGVTRSDTARNFLGFLCRDEVSLPPFLMGFVKDLLTKRRPKPIETKKEENPNISTETEEQERYSRLILDIQRIEGKKQSASVLKLASKLFHQDPFFPQALARFYYTELKDYNLAEMWAKRAKLRDPLNSFIADTLGQVHKNHLNNIAHQATPREILNLARKAIEAFEDEERLAENECGSWDMNGDGNTKSSHVFNIRGKFGYLQVCNLVYDALVWQNNTWRGVLTKRVSLGSVLESLGDKKLNRFHDLINSLRDEVERKCAFFDKYLTYSKPDMRKDDPRYISEHTTKCYRNYVGDSPPRQVKQQCADLIQKLKERSADTPTGVLSCLDRQYSESELKEITTWWEEIFRHNDSVTALVNYILAHIMLMNLGAMIPNTVRDFDYKHLNAFGKKMALTSEESPELHMLALLLYWPTDSNDKSVFDLSQLIRRMHSSYEHTYKTYFRSRYLRPLFFIGNGKDLKRIVHRKVLEGLFNEQNKETIQDWGDERIFQDPKVQAHLLKVQGEVRNYRVYATVGGTEIEVHANLQSNIWRNRQVSFYLGFTIRGPVAFAIHKRPAENAVDKPLDTFKSGEMSLNLSAGTDAMRGLSGGAALGACADTKDSSDWNKLQPEVNSVDEVHTYRLQSGAGRFECTVSALRWVCKEKVSITYQFNSWEEYMRRPLCMCYMPAGPLLDITVTTGKLEEVHLPHCVCVDHDSKISDEFAVLHVGSCGDFVEQVSEVTKSHVRLLQPTFTPIGVIIKKTLGIPFYYDVLIYKTTKEYLTLDVFLVPRDPALLQEVEKKQRSCGSVVIRKPYPDKPMQIGDELSLTSDNARAKMQPTTREFKYNNRNLFEAFIRKANCDVTLRLVSKGDTVWTCSIHEGDYQSCSHALTEDQHFVDRHRTALIDRVRDTGAILDRLKAKDVISNETYDAVRLKPTTQEQMREILRFVTSAGTEGKDTLYKILKSMKSMRALVSELQESG